MKTQVEAFDRSNEEHRSLAQGILEALLGLQEGSVEIKVSEGRVVEISRRENQLAA